MKLKPCPFCGKTNTLALWDNDDNNTHNLKSYTIVCDASKGGGCGASGGFDINEDIAEEKWNRRYNENTRTNSIRSILRDSRRYFELEQPCDKIPSSME